MDSLLGYFNNSTGKSGGSGTSLFILLYFFLYSLRLPTHPPSGGHDGDSWKSQEILRNSRELKGQQENSGHQLTSSRQILPSALEKCKIILEKSET